MTLNLNGTRILFLSAKLFDYQTEICKAMRNAGAIVDYFDERPANSFLVKALIRINRNLLSKYINDYHNRIIQKTRSFRYDYIFFTKGESVSSASLKLLRQLHPEARLIIYHWDSIANNRNAQRLFSCFDKIFSFDKKDCEQFGLHFLPLFYIPDYAKISTVIRPKKYDMLFIGTTHSDRYRLIKRLESAISQLGGRSFSWFYFPSKILYYKMKLLNPDIRKIPQKSFHFKPMAKEVLLDLFASSGIVADIQHPKQTGLTMRCIETLGAKKKLITTNPHIAEYDFYNPNNILIVNRDSPIIDKRFFNTPYTEIPADIYEKYSIDGWLTQILQS